MKNKTVKMVLSVVVLIALCGAYVGVKTYVAKQEEKENAEEEEDETVSIFSASTDDMTSIKFLIDKKEVTFEKTDDEWVKSDDVQFPVDQDKLDELAGALNDLTAQRVLEDVTDLSEYGLDSPDNTITVTTDEEECVIRVGEENDSVSQYYVKKNDDDTTVYLVAAASITPFMDELYDYAQGNDFPDIDSSNITQIDVTGDSDYSLTYDSESATWSVYGGEEEEKADSAQATSMISTLSSIEYQSFVNYDATDEDMQSYGLLNPSAEITVYYEEEAPEEETDTDAEESDTEEVDVDDTDTEDAEETDTEEVDVDDIDTEDVEETDVEEADAEVTDAEDVDEEDTEEESEPEMISKELVLHIGGSADADTRYVCIDDSREVYTMSEDTISAYINKNIEDLYDMTVSYLAVSNLESIKVTYNNENNTVNVSRETSEDEDGTVTETRSFILNGEELDEGILFTTFYNKLINMAGQKRLTEEYEPNEKPEMTVTMTDTDNEKTVVKYYSYDSSFYAAVVNNEKVYLVNKMTVKEMFESYEELVGDTEEEEQTTTEAEEDSTEDTTDDSTEDSVEETAEE
jgi:hypothetical protein